MPEAGLEALQAWMQDAILAGGADPALVAERIAGDERLPAGERLAIYARGYRGRLLETLRAEYPALRLLVGETVFDLFASAYIDSTPPTDPRLQVYGLGFAGHLDSTRPAGGDPFSVLPAQLARLERARAEVQRAQGTERLAPLRLTADAALLPGLRLRLPDSVSLIRLGFDFTALLAAADSGEPAPVPKEKDSPTIVFRAGYRVATRIVDPARFAFLEALAQGAEVHEAAADAASRSGIDTGTMLADLALWLPLAGGLVVAA